MVSASTRRAFNVEPQGRVAQSTLLVAAASVAGLVIAFLARPLLARFLGPSEYGVFALILAAGAAIPAFTLLSLNQAVTFFAARSNRDQARRFATSALAFVTLATVVFAIPLFFLTRWLFPAIGLDEFFSALVLSYGLSVFYVVQGAQQGVQDYSGFGRLSAYSALAAAALSITAALAWPSGSLAGVARGVGLFLVAVGFGLALGGWSWPSDAVSRAKQMLKYAWPLAASGWMVTFIIVIDRYFLAATHANADVAFFDLAYSTGTLILTFAVSLLIAVSPKLMKDPATAPGYYRKVAQGTVFVICAYGFTLFALAEPLVRFLLGDGYAPVALPLRLVGAALPLMALYQLNGTFFGAVERTRASGLLSAALVVASFAFNAWLVPPYAAPGAAAANLFSYVLIAFVGSVWLRQTVGVSLRAVLPTLVAFYAFMLADTFVLRVTGLERVGLLAAFALVLILLNLETVQRLRGEIDIFLKRKLGAYIRVNSENVE